MPTLSAHDGTTLAYHVIGDGPPLICLPGGPMRASEYLGELGGLGAHRRLIMLDLRGTGESAVPGDPATYRCDRLVEDVEVLRRHLGLKRVDLLAHSAGANLAALYVGRHPDRVGTLTLVTPSVKAVGIEITGDQRLATARLRRDEPWFESAYEALETIVAGNATDETWLRIDAFSYGRWDDTARAHQASDGEQRNDQAEEAYGADGAFDPDATRAALARFDQPVLLLVGEVDLGAPPQAMAEYAGLFPNAELVVQPGAGHFPWLDDASEFERVVATYLA